MDLEALKLILQTINESTGDAKTFGMAWLALNLIKALLAYGFGVLLVTFGIKLGHYIAGNIAFIAQLRDMIDPDQAGTDISHGEKTQIRMYLRKGLEKDR